ncbi:hypothetical protein BC829DRAFT_35334 [Chytridium lagenaria]|nr:hypothetical protein BC829DRAFT_35334 [Chytridium lagenaria]
MDLPERVFLQKINSRVGSKRVVFKAYTVDELSCIIAARTGNSFLFQRDAIEFCSRKVAGISGDARRALDICQHALESFKMQLSDKAGVKSITREFITVVIKDMFFSPQMRAVQNSAPAEQQFLVAFCSLMKRTKLSEFSLGEMVDEMSRISLKMNEDGLPGYVVAGICRRLFSSRFILVQEGKHAASNNRIRLNMPESDIMLALRLNKEDSLLRILDR